MGGDVYVVQAVTTGPGGCQTDSVVQIGIAAADYRSDEAESAYFETVRPARPLTGAQRAWLEEAGLAPEKAEAGVPAAEAAEEVRRLLKGSYLASFDVGGAIGRHLVYEPWDLTGDVSIMPSICGKLPFPAGGVPADENRAAEAAYDLLYPGDARGVGGGRTALDFALKAAFVLLDLRARGLYRRQTNSERTMASKAWTRYSPANRTPQPASAAAMRTFHPMLGPSLDASEAMASISDAPASMNAKPFA